VLNKETDLSVVATVSDPTAATAAVTRLHPRVAVIDADLDGRNGLAACAAVKSSANGTRVLLTGESENPDLLLEGVAIAVDGYATRAEPLVDLVEATRIVAGGQARIPPRMLGVLLHQLIDRRRHEDAALQRLSRLTWREKEVLGLLTEGLSREDIAGRLTISPETSRTHVQRVLTKLEVHSQLEAAALAVNCGFADRFARDGVRP
jgi:DNA-binding NarL/FixJ family response regulator